MSSATIQHTLDTIEATIKKVRDEHHLPGVAVSLVHQNKVIYAGGAGWANVAEQTAVTADTIFRIASVSKTFAAVALMQLWEQGKFDLHDPVNDYLKDYRILTPRHADHVTFHHLLTHTSGIGEFTHLLNYLRPRAHFNVVRPHQKVPDLKYLYGRSLHTECHPSEKWCYSNNGFATVGQLVADISGQPFKEYVRDHILAPLAMDHSEFWRSERVIDGLAIGYNYRAKKGGFKKVWDLEQVTTAAGAMYASVNDMAKFTGMLANEGRYEDVTILKPETMALMYTSHFQLHPRLKAMGYGFKIEQWGEHRIIAHDGLWLGFFSSMFVAPDDDLSIFVTTNRASNMAVSLAYSLLRQALGDSARKHPMPSGTEAPPTPEKWPQFVGYYTPDIGINTNFRFWTSYGGELEVFIEDKQLKIRSPKGSWRAAHPLLRSDVQDPLLFRVGRKDIIFEEGDSEKSDHYHDHLHLLMDKLVLKQRGDNYLPVYRRVQLAILFGSLALIALLLLFLRWLI